MNGVVFRLLLFLNLFSVFALCTMVENEVTKYVKEQGTFYVHIVLFTNFDNFCIDAGVG